MLTLLLASLPAQGWNTEPLDPQGLTAGTTCWRVRDGSGGGIVGAVLGPGAVWRPALFDSVGPRLLPLLAGDEAGFAWDADDAGFAVGESDDVVFQYPLTYITPHATVWSGGAAFALVNLVTSGPAAELWNCVGVNDAGQILVRGRLVGGQHQRGFLFENGALSDVGSLVGTADSSTEVTDLNQRGWIVGSSESGFAQFPHAFLYRDGIINDLHAAAGIPGRTSTARAVNESGLVAGSADWIADYVDWETVTLWRDGVALDLGTPGGGEGWAFGVNDHGEAVGGGVDAQGNNVAWIWRGAGLENLNGMIPPGSGWYLLSAWDIGNDGVIAAEGSFNNALQGVRLLPDGTGAYSIYGTGCAGSGGFTPRLFCSGWAEPGGAIALAVVNGFGGALGALLLGSGSGVLPIAPGCDLQILPLLAPRAFFTLGGAGAGAGQWNLSGVLPPGSAGANFHLQAVLQDPGAPGGLTVTAPLLLEVR
jgi:probable HAF family extracellular repeat protein